MGMRGCACVVGWVVRLGLLLSRQGVLWFISVGVRGFVSFGGVSAWWVRLFGGEGGVLWGCLADGALSSHFLSVGAFFRVPVVRRVVWCGCVLGSALVSFGSLVFRSFFFSIIFCLPLMVLFTISLSGGGRWCLTRVYVYIMSLVYTHPCSRV